MIKVKIQNVAKGRNEPTFRPFLFIKNQLRDYSIDITNSNDYDYLFIGMQDFINKRISLKESINTGLENLSKITGDYFLFDGSDSHSLMGAYEVLKQSNAIYLFKNQLHKDKKMYKIPKAFGKWYFGDNSGLELSYNIPDEDWNRIKLTGWNMMSNVPNHKNYQPINLNKSIDVCAIFGSGGGIGYDHEVRNDIMYKEHREKIFQELKKLKSKYNIALGSMDWQNYMQTLYNSKICISPFGMGEIRQGDGECVQMGTLICKENMSMFDFGSNVWEEEKTYIPFEYDCSNLVDQLDKVLSNYNDYKGIVNNMRKKYLEDYSPEKLCKRWYDIFSNMDSVVYE